MRTAVPVLAALAVSAAGARVSGDLPRGTAVCEYRDEYSRHYSNSDGTISAEIHATPLHRLDEHGNWVPIPEPGQQTAGPGDPETDLQVNVYPYTDNRATGYIYRQQTGTYTMSNGDISWRYWYISSVGQWYRHRGWSKFDLSSIPGGSDVTAATLYYCAIGANTPERNINFCSADPQTAGYQAIYDAIGVGETYANGASPGSGWKNDDLNFAGVQKIEDRISSPGWIALGWDYPYTFNVYCDGAYGYTSGNKPYILVTYTPPNPVPTISSIIPASKNTGDPEFELTVDGSNFVDGQSVVRFDGSDRATAYVSPTQVTATIPARDLLVAGTFDITVFNPTPGGGESNAQMLTVNNLVPTLTGIVPGSGIQEQTLDVLLTGTNYADGVSSVSFGTDADITINSTRVEDDQHITVNITIDAGAAVGPRDVSVMNAAPGGGTATITDGFAVVASIPPWPYGWSEAEPIPGLVKRGGWLAVNEVVSTVSVWAVQGLTYDGFREFGAHGVQGAWTTFASIPPGEGRAKPPGKGSDGICDGRGKLYMTKGYNTLQFWQYDIDRDSWSALPDVPEGPSRKKVKGGTDLAYVDINDTGWVYLLKGYRTEFYRFNTVTGSWDMLPDLPYGYKAKWDKGSWLAYDGGQYLYAHQAKYYDRASENHHMFRFDLATQSWDTTSLTGMPLWGLHGGRLRKKKAKDGSAGAYFAGRIYALKGGNSQQFFAYDCTTDTWTELDTMPAFSPTTGRRRRVKYGADLVHWAGGVFFVLKGNKTSEFWRYRVPEETFGQRPAPSGILAGRSGSLATGLTVAPSPLKTGQVTLRYSLPKAGAAVVSVYDVTGRTVLSRSLAAARAGAISLNVRSLSAGSYLVRLDSGGYTTTQKLVIQK